MSPAEYLEAIKARLLTDPVGNSFSLRRERSTLTDGFISGRVLLADGRLLEFPEYVKRRPDNEMEVVTYSYHESIAG